MVRVALVGLVDSRGRVLLQERDEFAPTDPNRWSLVGGAIEPGESAAEGARRELREETGIEGLNLIELATRMLPCALHGSDEFTLFTVRADVPDDEVQCHEGRQIIFVQRSDLTGLELGNATSVLLPLVLAYSPAPSS